MLTRCILAVFPAFVWDAFSRAWGCLGSVLSPVTQVGHPDPEKGRREMTVRTHFLGARHAVHVDSPSPQKPARSVLSPIYRVGDRLTEVSDLLKVTAN